MRSFSAQYVITNDGPALRKAIVNTDDDGTIIDIEDTAGILSERHSVEFHNGIIIPGFVNCHCHLELSHMKGMIPRGCGLGSFVEQVRTLREQPVEMIRDAARQADFDMFRAGVNLCGDICNTGVTFSIKKESKIKYINLVEVYGINPSRAAARMEEASAVLEESLDTGIPSYLVPHSLYSVSLPLMRMIRKRTGNNRVTSVHFMESREEKDFIASGSGPLLDSYRRAGLISGDPQPVKSHAVAILEELTCSGNIILVHNTFADRATIRETSAREHLYWCLCPNSNRYIENTLPPVDLLLSEHCRIAAGTDSLASNDSLGIMEELITLQLSFPSLTVPELVSWATVNGARALGEHGYGIIRPGLKPGLLLLQNVDLQNMKLLPESVVTRLV